MVLAAWYLERHEKKRNRVRAEARAEVQAKWEEWNRRREAAAAAGEVFTEPPPSLTGPVEAA